MFQKLITLGSSDKLPDFIANRIPETNTVAIGLAISVAIPFFFISLHYAPMLAFLPASGTLTCLSVLLINALGGVRYSRFLISVFPIWLIVVYNAYLTDPNTAPVGNLYLISISFLIVPFALIDRKEKWFLTTSVLLCSLAILLFPYLCEWFRLTEQEKQVVASYKASLDFGWLSTVTAVLAILSAGSSMLALNQINRRSEKKIEFSKEEIMANVAQLEEEKQVNEAKTKELEKARQLEQRREWAATGTEKIYQVMRDQDDEGVLDTLLKTIVHYLHANQGGLFRSEQKETTSIILSACYAYERKKYLEKCFQPGEGLIGQVFLEKEPLYLSEVPQDYIKIGSGLGAARPRYLLIVPMITDDLVTGVIELASFQPIEEHEQRWLVYVGEVVASFLQNQSMMRQTRELLEQAQLQGEELRAVEEEMRQNQEELQATQEQMYREHAMMKESTQARENELLTEIEALKEKLAMAGSR